MPSLPHTPPQWARGDVGREIGKWILAEIKEQLFLAGINSRNINGGNIIGVVPAAATKLIVYLNGLIVGAASALNFSSNFVASTDTAPYLTVADGIDVDLSDTGVTPGAYGNVTFIPLITVDAKGRLTSAGEVEIIAGGGGATVLNDLTDVNTPTPANNNVLTWDSTPGEWVAQPPLSITANQRRASITFQFGDGANVITTSERAQWLECNFDGTLEGWSLLADVSGSIVVDVWKDVYANYPPASGDSMAGSGTRPTLSSALTAQDNTLTGWTTTITRGDVIRVQVSSAGTLRAVTLTLRVVKT